MNPPAESRMNRSPSAARLFALTLLALAPAPAAAQYAWSGLAPDVQIQLALQAAPVEARADALVQGYDASGGFVTLREGDGELVCMAPAPDREQFEVSCHHRDLEPYFERGRELLALGITGNDRTRTRWEEYEAGDLPIPYGAVNYILTGSGFDPESGDIANASTRWVIYTPMATSETTGLSTRPAPVVPWLMFAGTPGSHIMIVPPDPTR